MYGSTFFTFGATQSNIAHDPEEDGPTSPRNVRTYRFKASQKFRIQKNAAVRILRCARYTSHSMPVTYAAPLEHLYGPEKKFNLVQQNLLPLVLQGILCFQYNSCQVLCGYLLLEKKETTSKCLSANTVAVSKTNLQHCVRVITSCLDRHTLSRVKNIANSGLTAASKAPHDKYCCSNITDPGNQTKFQFFQANVQSRTSETASLRNKFCYVTGQSYYS